ncbi:MAG: hypothetical protein LC118_13450 [Dehalococcoidia bacterium]|nr:hypothetical protein [Dehalococcoidia bacterium]
MQLNAPEPAVRPPVLLGCTGAVLVLVLMAAAVVFFVTFLDSGANNGKVTLPLADSFAPNTITYEAKNNFYFVRLGDGSARALSDLDAANRGAATRCRVAQLAANDPLLPQILQQYGARQSPQAAGSSVILREACNRAVYDLTGLRLDSDGPNLDSLAISLDRQGHVVVDTRNRTCTERVGPNLFSAVTCPK